MKGKDVLSIDLFDTLIMRKTLYPTDVIEIVECKLKERGIHIENFLVEGWKVKSIYHSRQHRY